MERTHVAIQQLVDRIDREELKLPEIQRGYVWKPQQVAALIESLYRRYPSGSMLLWRPTEDVLERPKNILASGAGPMAQAQYLLDGQQRLTSLHRVVKHHPQANVVFNVETERFQIQSAATAKDSHWVRVAEVLEAEKLSVLRKAICEAVPELDEDDVEERLGRLRAISKYEYYLEILTDLSYAEVADIFVRVNSKGRALKTVDLTLAVLSAQWPGVVAKIDDETSRWAAAGWPKIDTGFVVRALAATATDAGSLPRLPATPIEALEAGWARVKHGLAFLIHLLEENAGIKTSNLIPSINALVPLVVLLGRFDSSVEFTDADAVIYWLLAVFITGRYSAAADTKIAQDSLSARGQNPMRRMYESAGLIGAPVTVTEQQLLGKGVGSPFFLLSFLAAKRRKARDWWHDVEISESGAGGGMAIEYHHIHPQATLKDKYSKSEINDLANLAFISATANKKISNRSPALYFPELEHPRDELAPHLVPADAGLREAGQFREFLAARRRLLAVAMSDVLDERRPDWVGGADLGAADRSQPRAVSLTLVVDGQADLAFDAILGDARWFETAKLADLERFLTDAENGMASSFELGSELTVIGPGADDVSVPIGPYELCGSVPEWRAVIDRERSDAVGALERPPDAVPGPYVGSREPFPVLDTD